MESVVIYRYNVVYVSYCRIEGCSKVSFLHMKMVFVKMIFASYEYRSSNKGAQFLPIGIPTGCWRPDHPQLHTHCKWGIPAFSFFFNFKVIVIGIKSSN
jgi:hypothetical protein